jgi:hypothetical protein
MYNTNGAFRSMSPVRDKLNDQANSDIVFTEIRREAQMIKKLRIKSNNFSANDKLESFLNSFKDSEKRIPKLGSISTKRKRIDSEGCHIEGVSNKPDTLHLSKLPRRIGILSPFKFSSFNRKSNTQGKPTFGKAKNSMTNNHLKLQVSQR